MVTRERSSPKELNDTAAAIREVRERAELTWEHMAQLFGVSPRSVHLWTSGGRMTTEDEELLSRMTTLVNSMKDFTALDVRQAVVDLCEKSRDSRSSQDNDINRPATTWNAHDSQPQNMKESQPL